MFRILDADDDPVQLNLRKTVLEDAGHEVVSVLTTRQTAREVERGTIHLVIMDLRFPDQEGKPDCREGLRLIRRIRELDGKVPILVLSGWPEDLDGQPEERMISRVMMKPVKTSALLKAAGELLADGA
ncbi:MAG TPA: response regulator [Candidatus Acidoferrales bacterium]|nr:response regulator [Candidatus Acidoferrales bacterium]